MDITFLFLKIPENKENKYNYFYCFLLVAHLLTNSSSNDTSEEKTDRHVGLHLGGFLKNSDICLNLWFNCRNKSRTLTQRAAVSKQMFQDLFKGRDAQIERAARSKDGCHAEHEAR